MDNLVSAFSIYNANKKPQKDKKKKKKPKPSSPSKVLSDKIIKEAAHKLKRKQKKLKKSKKITEKNRDKKSKSKDVKNQVKKSTRIKNNKLESTVSPVDESDEVPALIPAPLTSQFNDTQNNLDIVEVQSTSSNGSFDFTPVQTDSAAEGLKVFKWMIAPHDPEEFLNKVWEKKPLHISRKKPMYYKEIISTPVIDDMLRNENILFSKNIDVTSYVSGERNTHNPDGRAYPHVVWDYYLNGCSVRLLNPQTYIPKLHLLNATMQEFFNSFVGANAYLTPPDSQGFAPHYDDIEAFILQAEGKKRWRIYKPLNDNEVLPRISSKNFSQDEIGEPIMEVTLEAGDMLYFPRGYIHQGVTIDGEHSLHVTVSMYQKHSWADLFEKIIPAALQMAIAENVGFRQGLPFDIYDNFGLVNSDITTPRRKNIDILIKSLFDKIKNHLPIDEAVDQMNKNYQHDALPPVLTDLERAVTIFGDSNVMIENGKVTNRVEISLEIKIRLLRKNILRMVSEEQIRLYYYVENSLEYHGNDLPYLEIEEEFAPAIETLITSYPEYVSVESLDLTNDSDKLQIAEALWEKGLIMTEYPMETIDD